MIVFSTWATNQEPRLVRRKGLVNRSFSQSIFHLSFFDLWDYYSRKFSHWQGVFISTKEKGSCLAPVATDDDGKAVVEVEEGTYILNNDTLGSYKYKEDYVVKEYGEYTVIVVAK